MNIVLTFSEYVSVLTKFSSIIGSNFGGGGGGGGGGGESGVFGGNLPPAPPIDRTL